MKTKQEKFEKVVEFQEDVDVLTVAVVCFIFGFVFGSVAFTSSILSIVGLSSFTSGGMFVIGIILVFVFFDSREVYWRKVGR